MDIQELKRRAGINEDFRNQVSPSDPQDAIGSAISELMSMFEEIQGENATPQHIQARIGDVIQILRGGIQQ